MSSVATVSAGPAFQGLENKLCEQLQTMQRTSFGSEYVAFHASRDEVLKAVRSLLEDENSGTMIRKEAEEYATTG